MINDSFLTVGSNSKIVVATVKKKKASVINLLTGKLRAKVSKKGKKHFYIKTQTAAMGVRGTDFMAIYNAKSKKSGLLTFEGSVAIKKQVKKMEKVSMKEQVKELKKALDKKEVKVVEVGAFSTTDKKAEVLDQVRIDENQFARIKLDPSLGAEELNQVLEEQVPPKPTDRWNHSEC